MAVGSLFGAPKLSSLYKYTGVSILGQLEAGLWDLLSREVKWGVYKDNKIHVEVDSVLSTSHRASAQVSDFKTMKNAFISYNKVATPMVHNLQLAARDEKKEALLKWLEENYEKPTTFDIVSDDKTYKQVTLSEYSIKREAASTADRIIAECTFIEVRDVDYVYFEKDEKEANTENSQNPQDVPEKPKTVVQAVKYEANNVMSSVNNSIADARNSIGEAYDSANKAVIDSMYA